MPDGLVPDMTTVEEFADLFRGFSHAYGKTVLLDKQESGKINTRCRTVKEPLTLECYKAHLLAETGLGVIPLLEGNLASCGALDIDEPDMNLLALELKIREHGFPLHVFRSKSGGAHCYVFLTEPAPARDVIAALKHAAQALGYGGCEIFPKQAERASPNDLGNWLNLPYHDFSATNRPLIHEGRKVELHEALPVLKAGRITPKQLKDIVPATSTPNPAPVPLPQTQAAGRNDFIFKAVVRINGLGLEEDALREFAHRLNDHATPSTHPNFSAGPLSRKEIDQIVDSALKYDSADDVVYTTGEALQAMNGRHAIVIEGGKTLVITIENDEVLKRSVIERIGVPDICRFYKERVHVGNKNNKPIYEPLGKFWTNHPKARRYRQVVFAPGAEPRPDRFNLWQGYSVKPVEGDCSLFHDHLLNNVCSGDHTHYEYFMNWMARMIQEPAKQGEVIIALRGGRGTGKGMVAKILARLIGQHALHLSNGNHLTGNFNAHLQDVIFVFSDEAFWAGDKAGESTLKTLATEPTIFIEPKGINGFQVPNYLHIMMASNNEWVVPAGPDERRYFVVDVSDARKQDTKYFGALISQMENGGYEALMYDLMHRDISGFNVRHIPQTDALKEQKLFSLTPIQRWWLDILMNGLLPEDNGIWSGIVSRNGLQESYIRSMKNTGQTRRSSETQLGAQLKHLVPAKVDVRKDILSWSNAAKNYVMESAPAYQFPDLQTCRTFFEAQTQTRYEWPPANVPEQHKPELEPEFGF